MENDILTVVSTAPVMVWTHTPKAKASFRTGTFRLENGLFVNGNMPYAAEFTKYKFLYRATPTTDSQGHSVHELAEFPKPDLRALRLSWKFPLAFGTRVEGMREWRELFISPWAFFNQQHALQRVAAYDREHDTRLTTNFHVALNEGQRILKLDGEAQARFTAVVLLYFGVVAQRLFDLGPKDIEGIGYVQIVTVIKRIIHDPKTAFDGVFFRKPPRRATNAPYEHETADASGHRAETETDNYVRGFLSLDRAIILLRGIPPGAEIPRTPYGLPILDDGGGSAPLPPPGAAAGDGEDGEEEEGEGAPRESAQSAAARLLAQLMDDAPPSPSLSSQEDPPAAADVSKPKARRGGGRGGAPPPVSVRVEDGRRATYLSSNALTVRVPMPNLSGLADEVWLLQAVKEMVMREVNVEKHSYARHFEMQQLVRDLQARPDFPVENVDDAKVYAAVSDGVRRGMFSAGDTRQWTWWHTALDSNAKVPDGAGLRAVEELAVARTHVFQRELLLAKWVAWMFKPSPARNPEHVRVQLRESNLARVATSGDLFPAGMALHEEQATAFARAITEPMTVIYGPSGVGKSTILKAIVASLAGSGKMETMYFVAFKNDTVAKMRRDFAAFAPESVFKKMTPTGEVTVHAAEVDVKEHPYPHYVYTTCDKLRTKFRAGANIRCSALIHEEGAVDGTEMLADVVGMMNWQSMQHAVIVGDNRQLDPIKWGIPFKMFADYPFAHGLTKDYRSEDPVLSRNLAKIRALDADIEVSGRFRIDFLPWEPHIKKHPHATRFSPDYMEDVARRVLAAFARSTAEFVADGLTPIQAYHRIRVLTPYNDVARYLSTVLKLVLWGPRGAASVTSSALFGVYSQCMRKDDTWENGVWVRAATPRFEREVLHVDERVYCKESEPEDGIYRGHISEIQYIVDAPFRPLAEDRGLALEQMNHKYGVPSTAMRIPRGRTRTIYLASGTVIPLKGNNYGEWLSSASAHTIYRSQGDEYPHVIVVLPPGNVADNPTIYTAVGRARKDVTVIAPKQLLIKAIETPGPTPRSLLDLLVRTYANPANLALWGDLHTRPDFARAVLALGGGGSGAPTAV